MRPKRVSRTPGIYAPVGLHLGEIKSLKYARYPDMKVIYDYTGKNPMIEMKIGLETERGKEDIRINIGTSEKVQWIWDNLAKALRIAKTMDAKDVIGKKLYVVIAGEVRVGPSGIERDESGKIIYDRKELRMKFIEYIPNSFRPVIEGDPALNNGIPSKDFLLNNVDIFQHLETQKVPDDEF